MKQLLAYRKFWLIFSVWWLAWMLILIAERHKAGWSIAQAAGVSAVSMLLLSLVCIAVYFSVKYYRPVKRKWLQILIESLTTAGCWFWLNNLLINYLYKENSEVMQWMQQTPVLRLVFGFFSLLCFVLFNYAWYYDEERSIDVQRKSDMEKLAKDAELTQLRQQLQPHFLFNTLNSISALVASQPDEARRMIQQLSDFLRGTLKKEDHLMVSLADELNHLQLYLEIEKVRFGHRLKTEIKNEEKNLKCLIPALLLQPVVENAIKFGLYDTMGEVIISVLSQQKENDLVITVKNPFDKETARPRQGTGFGLSSIERRLYLLFGRNDLLHTQIENNIFIATIKIPQTA